ncbi:MAG: fibrobacter succinogenes major paralogous domain-containing protein [Prosthecochloris sp.]|nr:fibrobacter succinogenes major paralogous domain-containing protein [Prosthecochloris sp.]
MKRRIQSSLFILCALFVPLLSSCNNQGSQPKETEPLTDIDGNVYKTVQIGDQIWMAENLQVTQYRNGDPIPEVQDLDEWIALETGAWSYYDNDPENGRIYGKLYNWYAVNDPRGLAPEGWRIPTEEDWRQLEEYLGMNPEAAEDIEFRGTEANVGGKLKEQGEEFWKNPEGEVTNETGFAARAGGYRDNDGPFCFFGKYGAFWSASETENGRVWFRGMTSNESGVYRFSFNKKCGFSVRCVRDAE